VDEMPATDAAESCCADATPEPQIAPLQTARSGGDEARPPTAARASMPELAAMLRRSASVPHPAAQRVGGADGVSSAALKGRERQAESILELWDLKRTMERTAKRDEAARAAAEQDKQRRLQLQSQQQQPKQKQQQQKQQQQQKPASRQQASSAKPSGTEAR
jgi:hypothetical protein